jgi:hypothetical protein
MKHAMLWVAVAGALLSAGCDEKKASTSDPRGDAGAGTDKYASADPKLTKALQAAAASASAASDNGPPPAGIFASGAADQRHPRGAPTKVDVVSEGASPGVSLASTSSGDGGADAALLSSYGPAALNLATQMGQRMALPTLDLLVQLGPAKKEDGGPDWLVAEVKRSRPAREQLGQLPPGLDKEIANLEGTLLRLKVTNDGRESEAQEQLAKSASPDLDRFAQNAVEALVFATVPLPAKPLGVGAQWIAETRMPLGGVDVVAYRAYRIKALEGDRVRLSIDVKAYATSKDVQLSGVPKGATLEQFDAEAQGELELVRGEFLARKSDVQQRVVLIFAGPGGPQAPPQPGAPPGNMLTAQIQSRAKLLRGDDLRAALKNP